MTGKRGTLLVRDKTPAPLGALPHTRIKRAPEAPPEGVFTFLKKVPTARFSERATGLVPVWDLGSSQEVRVPAKHSLNASGYCCDLHAFYQAVGKNFINEL